MLMRLNERVRKGDKYFASITGRWRNEKRWFGTPVKDMIRAFVGYVPAYARPIKKKGK